MGLRSRGKEDAMSSAENEAIGRKFFAEQDRLHGEPAPDLCAATYTVEINGFPAMDRAGHHNMAISFFNAFPDLHQTVEETVADDERVVVRFRAVGTHLGDFMGNPATGKPINVVGTAILRIHNGKVTSLKEVFDLHALLQQIGALAG
jgi:steroid delta-isomerase-like uncharacterized protein